MTGDYERVYPDLFTPPELVSLPLSAYDRSLPPWPATMIEPSGAELIRWAQLWGHPLASVWLESEQEHVVATLVRAEQRCARRRRSLLAEFEVNRLRSQLGLDDN
jgi:hypothetical protein